MIETVLLVLLVVVAVAGVLFSLARSRDDDVAVLESARSSRAPDES